MKILILTENFSQGGLETQLLTYIKELKEKNQFYIAVDNYIYNEELEKLNIKTYTNFNFKYDLKVKDMIDNIERLEKIIKEEKIDIINIQPFYSLFPGIILSQLCDIPCTYTYHGMRSVNFPVGVNDNILMNYAFNDIINKIISVSDFGLEAFKNNTRTPKITIPNPIDFKVQKHEIKQNKEWAVISRLDNDKIPELKELINNMNYFDIKNIDIFGDGKQKETLQKYINDNNLNSKVKLCGYSKNLNKDLNGKYNGIFAIGRSALEGIAFGYPVIIIGYGKISGLLTKELFDELKKTNLVNQYIKKRTNEEIKKEIKTIYEKQYNQISIKEVKDFYNKENLSKIYINELKNTEYKNIPSFKFFINEMLSLKTRPEKEINFYESEYVYNLLRNYVLPYTIDKELILMFSMYQRYFILNNAIVEKRKKWYNK